MIELKNDFVIVEALVVDTVYHNIIIQGKKNQLFKIIQISPCSTLLKGTIVIIDQASILTMVIEERTFLFAREQNIIGVYHG